MAGEAIVHIISGMVYFPNAKVKKAPTNIDWVGSVAPDMELNVPALLSPYEQAVYFIPRLTILVLTNHTHLIPLQ